MTNIIFSRKEFEKHIKITPEIIERITLFGTPLESIDSQNLEIEVFPNRPDLISLEGFMRSFKKFIGKSDEKIEYLLKKPEQNYRVNVDSSVKNIRPFIACAIIKRLNLTEEKLKDLINMQEKLSITLGRNRKKMAIGIYPSDKMNFPINYKAKKPDEIKFIPLGTKNELSANDILTIHQTGIKYESLLKGSEKYPILIDSKNEIISMPPIINSENIGRVDTNTQELFIECTGTDKYTVEKTLIILATSLAESGGTIHQVKILDKEEYDSPQLAKQKTKLSLENVNKLLGIELNETQVSNLLERMGHKYKKGIVETPPWRVDVLHEVDLIEDVAIAYGYDKFTPEMPNISTSGEESKQSIIKRKLSEIMIGLGMLEISTYHLVKREEIEKYEIKDGLELLNSKNEYKYLRPNLFIPLLRVMSENKDSEYPQKLFEIGRTFVKNNQKENDIEEKDNLIISISPANATEIKKHLDYLFKMLGLEYSIKEKSIPHLVDGRTCSIFLDNKQIGYFGEVHPNVLASNNIYMPVAIAEISIEEIYEHIN